MSSWLLGSRLAKFFQVKDSFFATRTTTSRQQASLVSDGGGGAGRKRTLEVCEAEDGDKEEEEGGEPASKIPRVQVQALLTDEILDHILRFVSVGDLKSCRHVNKHWNSVATARWKKKGVVVKVGGYSECLMDFVNFSRASGNGGSGNARVFYSMPSLLLHNISGLFAEIMDGSLSENPATIPSFAALCQPHHLKVLKLKLYLGSHQANHQARVSSLKQLLIQFLGNLEHLVLDFNDFSGDILFDPNHKLQSFPTPTKLKQLKILRHKCDVAQTSLEQGLLAQLLRESHDLEILVFVQSKREWSADLPPCYKMLFNLLNSAGGGGQLSKLKELHLTFKVSHSANCSFCTARPNNNGEAEEEAESTPALLPNSRLESLSFSRIIWKEMLNTLRHHQNTLLKLTIGVHVLPPSANANHGSEPPHAMITLPNLREFSATVQLSYKFVTTLLTLFPQLGSLGLSNPTAQQLRFVWKHFAQLHTLALHFVENSPVDEIFTTDRPTQDPEGANIMHLDSVLSGLSINSCEFIYAKIAADQSILPKSLCQPPPLLATGNTILNLSRLRSLGINSCSRHLYPVRLTEVGLVLVLLKLGSLTQLTLNWCTMLLPGTMALIEQHVSPAMSISISQQPDSTIKDLERAKGIWL